MRYTLSKLVATLGITFLLVGCGGGTLNVPEHLKDDFVDNVNINFDADPKLSFYNQKNIRYKKCVDKSLKLSQGQLTHFFNKKMKALLKREEFADLSRQLLVTVDIKGY